MAFLDWFKRKKPSGCLPTAPTSGPSAEAIDSANPLIRVRQKLARLRAMDLGLRFFGAKEHRYKLNAPLSESAVLEFERKYGVKLPEDYREFLLRVGNGGAGPYKELFPLPYTDEEMEWTEEWIPRGDIDKPFPLERPWNECGKPEEQYKLPAGADVHDGCIMLSPHDCGYFSFLVVTGKERGKVWNDFTTADGGLHPTGKTFLEWYEEWLDTGLKREMWL